jgi:hypothetical protein
MRECFDMTMAADVGALPNKCHILFGSNNSLKSIRVKVGGFLSARPV